MNAFFSEVFHTKSKYFLVDVSWCMRHWLGVDQDFISSRSRLLPKGKDSIRRSAVVLRANNLEKRALKEMETRHFDSPRSAPANVFRNTELSSELAKQIVPLKEEIIRLVAEVKLLEVTETQDPNAITDECKGRIEQFNIEIGTLRKRIDVSEL
eukprot:TRINITY_DN458_c1_g1_i1.p1 TRINITY_DN458_c1_g1~~TRINITY_DN458_c1_g1_i1.p1  ORF type:complete len:154 (-),score=25.55 TRINITY_DN458_c1_g1_i1:353-814(-)